MADSANRKHNTGSRIQEVNVGLIAVTIATGGGRSAATNKKLMLSLL